ncbi:MAG: cytochrome d ubiquinol oxidase subunit II, partial [Firmicutes bacterium]|nr:cytochrome d ubiquinol oxidase subunit II [Bacillota bacterium]
VIIAGMFSIYLALEGVDWGVAMWMMPSSADVTERNRMAQSILPIWQGHQVWGISAVGAVFAAFPVWYAEWLSGDSCWFVLLVLALLVRAGSFSLRAAEFQPRAGLWDGLIFGSSLAGSGLWILLLLTLFTGLPLSPESIWSVDPWWVLAVWGYALFVMASAWFLFWLQGSLYLRWQKIRVQPMRWAMWASGAVVLGNIVMMDLWPHAGAGVSSTTIILQIAAALMWVLWLRPFAQRPVGAKFLAMTAMIALLAASLFSRIVPYLLLGPSNALHYVSIAQAAASGYTLKIMLIAVAIGLPIATSYQIWVFRALMRRGRMTRRAA